MGQNQMKNRHNIAKTQPETTAVLINHLENDYIEFNSFLQGIAR